MYVIVYIPSLCSSAYCSCQMKCGTCPASRLYYRIHMHCIASEIDTGYHGSKVLMVCNIQEV